MPGYTKSIVVRQKIEPITLGGSCFKILANINYTNGIISSAELAEKYEAKLVNTNCRLDLFNSWMADPSYPYGSTMTIIIQYNQPGEIRLLAINSVTFGVPVDSV